MSTQTPASPAQAHQELDVELAKLQDILERISDGDLHRAHRDGGWTVAEVVSHINVCALMWLGDLQRLRDDPELSFFFREEIGHDLTGYPPPTAELAAKQLASTRRTLAHSIPATDESLLGRSVEIPDLGTMTVAEWTPIITGHLAHHVGQAMDIMRDREVLPRSGE